MGTLGATAVTLLVGPVLLMAAAILLILGQRRRENLLLAGFLAAVAANFLLGGVENLVGSDLLHRLAFVALAIDPLLLLAFASVYPYEQRTAWVNGLLAVLATGAILVPTGLLLLPHLDLAGWSAPAAGTWYDLAVHQMLGAYLLTWLLVVQAAIRAPTEELARQAGWVVMAVGAAVVPRLGLAPVDLGVSAFSGKAGSAFPTIAVKASAVTQELALAGLLMAAAYGLGHLLVERAEVRHPAPLDRSLRVVGWVIVAFLVIQLIGAVTWFLSGVRTVYTLPFGLRWLIFSGLLVWGVLASQALTFDKAADRAFGVLGAVTLGLAVFLGTLTVQEARGTELDVLAALALGLAATAPGMLASRAVVRRITARRPQGSSHTRRLALYRASLEAAWASGPPGRGDLARLERDRRSFGVSYEEARTLEHVVAADLGAPGPSLGPGAEPVPGLVIERSLGEGAHGEVFRARAHPSGERVVLKVLKPAGERDRGTRARLLEELRALERLDHPNIVRLRDVHVDQGTYLLVLDHVDAVSLEEHAARRHLAPAEAGRLVLQVLDALESAHRRGVVHRDLKPANLLVDREGQVHLTDFGVALVKDEPVVEEQTVTHAAQLGSPGGTLAYMAPEQVRGDRVDAHTDIYQVGLVLFELLTGRKAHDLRGLVAYEAAAELTDPEIDVGAVPPAWRPVVERALAPEPTARFETASAMRKALLDGPLSEGPR